MSRFCLGNADPAVRTNFEPIRFADNPACPHAGSDVSDSAHERLASGKIPKRWTPAEDAMLGTMPDRELAPQSGRSVGAVADSASCNEQPTACLTPVPSPGLRNRTRSSRIEAKLGRARLGRHGSRIGLVVIFAMAKESERD
jgi:hypothetical protein